MPDSYERELATIESVEDAPPLKKFGAYAKLSGPGWLQGAITLGGGSLTGALFLGVVSGYGLMWLQPLAMICGIIMLSAIAYVTLSTGARPFHMINRHLNPLLGWSWLVATIMANIVWTMPQFALGTAAIQQNLLGNSSFSPFLITIPLLALGLFVNWLYEAGGAGAKAFDLIIKILVGIIVLSFIAVVVTLLGSGQLQLGKLLGGYIPNPSLLFKPAPLYETFIAQSSFPDFWREKITSQQQDVIITAFGTAVGINMTFLLPYTLLKKRWGKKHRGLSITDLSIGLFIPFFLATSCVVISAAASFHGKIDDLPAGAGSEMLVPLVDKQDEYKAIQAEWKKQGLPGTEVAPLRKEYLANITAPLSPVEFRLAAMLQSRDAGSLALTLEPFTGRAVAQKVFGVGVLGMAVSTIIILMLMNGIAFQEAFSKDPGDHSPAANPASNLTAGDAHVANINDNKKLFFIGCAISGIAGALFPLVWTGESKAALAVPTSVIGGSLIPIAYFTFFLMMNSKKILGDARPTGRARVIWNVLMVFATSIATFGSLWTLQGKAGADNWIGYVAKGGIVFLILLFVIGTFSFLKNEKKGAS